MTNLGKWGAKLKLIPEGRGCILMAVLSSDAVIDAKIGAIHVYYIGH